MDTSDSHNVYAPTMEKPEAVDKMDIDDDKQYYGVHRYEKESKRAVMECNVSDDSGWNGSIQMCHSLWPSFFAKRTTHPTSYRVHSECEKHRIHNMMRSILSECK